MIGNLFGLAQDGQTNSKGMPTLLQGALFAREFRDVIVFTKPPLGVQRLLFPVLALIGRALGYKGSYPKYIAPEPASGEVAGPPSTTRVVGGAFAVAASLLLASLFLLRGTRCSPNSRRMVRPILLALAAVLLLGSPAVLAQSTKFNGPMPQDATMRVFATGLSNPFEVIYGPDGLLWVTERTAGRITRLDPADGAATTLLAIDEGGREACRKSRMALEENDAQL